jgi:hypothetical protein
MCNALHFEKNIEQVLNDFFLSLSDPQIEMNSSPDTFGYSKYCKLRTDWPSHLVLSKYWQKGQPDLFIINLRITSAKIPETQCQIALCSTGQIILGLDFYDYDKLKNYVPDPSLLNFLKTNKSFFEGQDLKTGKMFTFEKIENGDFKETNPTYLDAVRNMLMNDVLYEQIYSHDKKKFDEKISDSKSRGDLFLEDLAFYFYKSRRELGFSF